MNINNRWFQLVRVADRDDHDREPAVRVDAVRQADAGRHRLEAVRHPVGVHAVHPVSDLGAAARGLADRSAGPARVHQRRRACCAASAGRAWATPRRCRCSTRCTCVAGIGAALVYSGSHRIGAQVVQRTSAASPPGIMAAGFGGGTALFIPFIASMIQHQRLSDGVLCDRHLSGRGDPDRRAVPAASAGGSRRAPKPRGGRDGRCGAASVHHRRDAAHAAVLRALRDVRDDGDRRPAGHRERRADGEVVGHSGGGARRWRRRSTRSPTAAAASSGAGCPTASAASWRWASRSCCRRSAWCWC